MAEKLNQVLATLKGAKNRAENKFTEIFQNLGRPNACDGLKRTYQPRVEGDEIFPEENKRVAFRAEDLIKELSTTLADLFDTVAKQDRTNCEALADLVVDGKVLVEKVPVTHLLFAEKKLTDLLTFVRKLPVLDPSEDWSKDPVSGYWKAPSTKTVKTKKATTFVTVAEATKEHPAQVKEQSNDVVVGEWTQTKSSGALPADRVAEILRRTETMLRAVKYARAQANTTPVVELKTGAAVLGYIFN